MPATATAAQPPYLYPDYASTVKRAPNRPPIRFEHTLSEITGPGFADGWAGPDATDLTEQHKGEPLGERIIVPGRVLDEDGRPVPGTLVELWQCNSAGRYHHPVDQHDAPLDPNFTGVGQVVTDADGRYRFLTIKPGAYPWRNTPQCLAAGAYPFRRVRPRLRDPARHADVFPRRPAARLRPDLPEHRRRRCARAADLPPTTPNLSEAGMGARLSLRHGAARPRRHAGRPG